MTLEGNCHRCHGPATRLITRGPQVKSTTTTEWYTLDAICDECAAKRRRETTVGAADVERHLGTLVEFMPAQDRREAKLRRWRWLWTPSASPLYALLLLGGAASGVALLRRAEDGFAGVTGRTVSGVLCVVLAQASLMCRFRALTTQNDRAAILYSWAMAVATAGVIGSFVATMLLST